jgi:hypothetical protein
MKLIGSDVGGTVTALVDVVCPCAVYTAGHDGGNLRSRVPDAGSIGQSHHAGHRVMPRDSRDALIQMFILAWEGRTWAIGHSN